MTDREVVRAVLDRESYQMGDETAESSVDEPLQARLSGFGLHRDLGAGLLGTLALMVVFRTPTVVRVRHEDSRKVAVKHRRRCGGGCAEDRRWSGVATWFETVVNHVGSNSAVGSCGVERLRCARYDETKSYFVELPMGGIISTMIS